MVSVTLRNAERKSKEICEGPRLPCGNYDRDNRYMFISYTLALLGTDMTDESDEENTDGGYMRKRRLAGGQKPDKLLRLQTKVLMKEDGERRPLHWARQPQEG